MPDSYNNIFVKSDAVGDNNGFDWFNAFNTLQDGIDYALSLPATGYAQIHVSENGSYSIDDPLTVNQDFLRIAGGYSFVNKIVNSGFDERDASLYKSCITVNDDIVITSGIFSLFNVYMKNTDDATYLVQNGDKLLVDKCDFKTTFGFTGAGYYDINEASAVGTSGIAGSTFIECTSMCVGSNIRNTTVSHYDNGMYINTDNFPSLIGNTIYHCNQGISMYSEFASGEIDVFNTLIHNCATGVLIESITSGSVHLEFKESTIHSNSVAMYMESTSQGDVFIDTSMISGVFINNASGSISALAETSLLTDAHATVFDSGSYFGNPNFQDTSNGQMNVMFGTAENTVTSDAFQVGRNKLTDNTEVTADLRGYVFPNSSAAGQETFMYQTKNNVVQSDFMREVALANFIDQFGVIDYEYNYQQKKILYNQSVVSAFPLESETHPGWPFEWDYKTIETPSIEAVNCIVPRSILDITDTFKLDAIRHTGKEMSFSNIKVRALKRIDWRGISFDYSNSQRGELITALVDGDQNLTFRDIYTGTELSRYPLLAPVPSGSQLFIRPSGLVPFGKTKDGFKFIVEGEPNTVIEGENEFGEFEWMPTHKNVEYDLRGLLAYKDQIYITSVYTNEVESQPVALLYPTKGNYLNYIDINPTRFELNPDNANPKGITVYEDGTIFIADGTPFNDDPNGTGICVFKYRPRYDYALKTSNFNQNTKLLLKEPYEDVRLAAPELILPAP